MAIDGKSLNGSYDRENSLKSLVMVSAWSSRDQLVLGQVAVKQKSNEIKAIPVLLEQLDLKDAIITIDAMGTQKAIAQQIQDSGADYILTLKANHPTLAEDARNWWEKYLRQGEKIPVHKTESIYEAGHHRIEKRCFVVAPADQVFNSNQLKQWTGLQTLIVEQSSPKGYRFAYRQLWNKTTHSTRFFLSSLPPNFTNLANSIRSHWGIEKQLHWCLDVIFSEDNSRIRKDHAPRNMTVGDAEFSSAYPTTVLTILKRLALNFLCQDTSRGSLKMKRYQAGLNNNFLLQIRSNILAYFDLIF